MLTFAKSSLASSENLSISETFYQEDFLLLRRVLRGNQENKSPPPPIQSQFLLVASFTIFPVCALSCIACSFRLLSPASALVFRKRRRRCFFFRLSIFERSLSFSLARPLSPSVPEVSSRPARPRCRGGRRPGSLATLTTWTCARRRWRHTRRASEVAREFESWSLK